MALKAERKIHLDGLRSIFRNRLIDIPHKIQSGHPGGSLSAAEVCSAEMPIPMAIVDKARSLM
jgi:transketolase N-terminal domain/subunit